MHILAFPPSFSGWRKAARRAMSAGWTPDEVFWEEWGGDQPALDLGGDLDDPEPAPTTLWRVSRRFLTLTKLVACHRDPERWALLYRLLWRTVHGESHLLEDVVDPMVHRVLGMEKSIRRDLHKMRAFVRFREVAYEGENWFVAWFEPEHHIVEENASFFVERFAQMRWSILTPDRCAHWDTKTLTLTPGLTRPPVATEDATEDLWLTYYAHIFNPARIKTKAMKSEMPAKYWKNLPEAALIPTLLEEAPSRVEEMLERSKQLSRPALPYASDLATLKAQAATCQACPLFGPATQTVFGEGPAHARLFFLGEQPGDSEDLTGRPFVGPAGQLFDRALAEVGLDRSTAYVTNSVKHFKFAPRGKNRLHKKANSHEAAACRPWLVAELQAVQPEVLVCLGGTAAQAIFGPSARVQRDRGQWRESEFCPATLITFHPSALLRKPDEAERERDYADFVADLRLVAEKLLERSDKPQ